MFAQRLAQWAEAILLQEGTTDAAGHFVLSAAARADLALHVRGPGHPPVFVPRVDTADPSLLRIEVPVAGRIEGMLRPAEVARLLRARVRLFSADDPRQQVPEADVEDPAAGLPVRDDGKFACDSVPPGDWHVHVVFRHSGALRVDRIGHVAGLRAGETRQFEADLGGLRPGHLQARVLLDGAAAAHVRTALRGAPPEGNTATGAEATTLVEQTDAHGALAAELLPGRYRLSLVMERRTPLSANEIVSPDEIVITAGGHTEHTFVMRRLRVRVRIVDGQGMPVAGRPFHVQGASILPTMPLQTDADGVLVIDPAPLGAFHLQTWPPELDSPAAKFALLQRGREALAQAMLRLGPIEVPAGKAEAAVELALPSR
jgi:hypothetical protein